MSRVPPPDATLTRTGVLMPPGCAGGTAETEDLHWMRNSPLENALGLMKSAEAISPATLENWRDLVVNPRDGPTTLTVSLPESFRMLVGSESGSGLVFGSVLIGPSGAELILV